MTALDPYPPDLASLDSPFAPASLDPISEVPLIREVARIATALEQIALALMDRPVGAQTPQVASAPTLAALPPVQAVQPAETGVCPIHHTPWKVVPGGISKRTGNAYESFRACSTTGCDQRPPR